MVLQGFHKGTIPKFTALQFMLGFGVLGGSGQQVNS